MMTQKGIEVPDGLSRLLESSVQLSTVFEKMRPSCQKKYVSWLTEAKKPETVRTRLEKIEKRFFDYGRRHGLLSS